MLKQSICLYVSYKLLLRKARIKEAQTLLSPVRDSVLYFDSSNTSLLHALRDSNILLTFYFLSLQ